MLGVRMLTTIRLYHRVAVDCVADNFGLRGQGSARARHDGARDRAHALARSLPERWHRPREPRVLRSWQARIGQVGAASRGRS
jgi:hypothetical protein